MEPSIIPNIAVGETREVQILLKNVDGLHEIEIHISFEPRIVNIVDADPNTDGVQIQAGDMPIPTQVIKNDVQNNAGQIIYHVAQDEGSTSRGDGLVATFTVQAMTNGGSPLQFTIVKLTGAGGQPLQDPQRSSSMIVIGVGDEGDTQATEPAASNTTPVPTSPATVPTAPAGGFTHYTVQPGDTLYSIATRHGTTVDAVIAANGLPDATIRVGQVLLIPVGDAGTTGGKTYVVQPGDTLYSIATRHGTTVQHMAELNGIAPPYTITVGQTLIVP
jgi:LysM repeat protein